MKTRMNLSITYGGVRGCHFNTTVYFYFSTADIGKSHHRKKKNTLELLLRVELSYKGLKLTTFIDKIYH